MAPSPELGQPKPRARDKVDSKQCPADGTTNNSMDIQKSTNATEQSTEERIQNEDHRRSSNHIQDFLRHTLKKKFDMLLVQKQRLSRIIYLIREFLALKYGDAAAPQEYNDLLGILQGLLPENYAPFPARALPNTSIGEAGEHVLMSLRNFIQRGGIDAALIDRFNLSNMFDPELSDVSMESPGHAAPNIESD